MSHGTFLQDLAVVIVIGALGAILFRHFKLPVVLGYITAGVVIGPHTPPFALIADTDTINTLSELGVIFLMFSLGLEFSLRKVKEVGSTAVLGASMEILLMGWIGYHIGLTFGWNKVDSIFLGALLAMSSTTIIIKALDEMGLTKERFASLIFGILIVEDILGILILALISGFAATGSLAPAEVGMTMVTLSAFLGVVLVVGLILVPRLLEFVAKFKSNELLLLAVVALCFAVCLLTVKLGYSVALGAFLIGAVIAEARQIARIEMLTFPVRDIFSAVFFVSIGLLIDPAQIVKYWAPILVITTAVIVGKVVACSFGTFIAGNDTRTSMRVGMGLAQIGEFSFIIAGLGLSLKLTSDFIYPIAVAVSAVTTLLTPFLIRWASPTVTFLERVAPTSALSYMEAYTRWFSEFSSRKSTLGATLLKKWGWQIGLNLLLITAVFIAAAAFKKRGMLWWPHAPGGENGLKAILWLLAMILSFPMFIAVFRKIQAMGMLISEMSVAESAAGANTSAFRGIISTTVVTAGCAGFVLLTLVLSSAILPSWNVLLVLALVLVGAAFLLRRTFTRVYAKAQIALLETFTSTPEPPPVADLPPLLRDAELLTLTINPETWGANKSIAELGLRQETGASIVGIERDGQSIVNPGASESLYPGDRILLLGTGEQLAASEALFKCP
ncbi:MAG TPA: cation:proton antiporter [Chthoniobacteraceae bacterium]|nr:cation:proton antiporter [Chthoniobacteraceae bacterium]